MTGRLQAPVLQMARLRCYLLICSDSETGILPPGPQDSMRIAATDNVRRLLGTLTSVLVVVYALLPTAHAIHCDSGHLPYPAHARSGETAVAPTADTSDPIHECGFCRILSHFGSLSAARADVFAAPDPCAQTGPDRHVHHAAWSPLRDDLGRAPPVSNG